MFAHAEFEEQVRVLQASIMKTPPIDHISLHAYCAIVWARKKRRRPWEFARPSKTHSESDQESSKFGQRSGGTADRSNLQGRHWPLRRAQSSRARPLVAIQSQDSDDQSA